MAQEPQGRRIVLCFDGTANQIGAGNLTNVAKLFEMLDKNNPASQLAYYDDNWAQFARAFCWRTENEPLFDTVKKNSPNQLWHYAIPVAYLGLWDTVKAAGFLRFGNLRWPYTRALPNVARIRHAVSIDEQRRPYREYLVERHPLGLEERWFAGVHADVGGTFQDHRLATIALKWVTDGIVNELAIDADAYRQQCTVTADFADAPIHNNGKLWFLVGRRKRPMGPNALVHSSVLARRRATRTTCRTLPPSSSSVAPTRRTGPAKPHVEKRKATACFAPGSRRSGRA